MSSDTTLSHPLPPWRRKRNHFLYLSYPSFILNGFCTHLMILVSFLFLNLFQIYTSNNFPPTNILIQTVYWFFIYPKPQKDRMDEKDRNGNQRSLSVPHPETNQWRRSILQKINDAKSFTCGIENISKFHSRTPHPACGTVVAEIKWWRIIP